MKFKAQIISIDVVLAISLFLATLIFFISLGSDFLIPKESPDLNQEAEDLMRKILSRNLSKFVETSIVNESVLNDIEKEDYASLKKELNVVQDFCIYFEDQEGNLMKINNASEVFVKYGIGSESINLSGIPCGSSFRSS